jgi:hypothetical protein
MKRASLSRATPALVLLLLGAAPAVAQQGARVPDGFCQDRGQDRDRSFTELRRTTLRASDQLSVDAKPNGGISVRGWDGGEVRVCAKVNAHAESEAAARALVSQVRVVTDGGTIHAEGPSTRDDDRSWSVSFEVLAPRRTALTLRSTNGGLRVMDVHGARMELSTTNGGISLEDVGGNVRGETTNGGIQVRLAGSRWEGAGLDLRTTNGGVQVSTPASFNAHLVTSTVNGRIDADDVPVDRGRWTGGRIDADLGRGGAPIRITTTNGGVRVRRGS